MATPCNNVYIYIFFFLLVFQVAIPLVTYNRAVNDNKGGESDILSKKIVTSQSSVKFKIYPLYSLFYIYVYVFMYVCTYAFMYVCMYGDKMWKNKTIYVVEILYQRRGWTTFPRLNEQPFLALELLVPIC